MRKKTEKTFWKSFAIDLNNFSIELKAKVIESVDSFPPSANKYRAEFDKITFIYCINISEK